MEKASGGTDTGDGTEVNVGATLKQLQADFSKFRAESADAKLANESKVRELEGRLAGADKDPRAVTMPPPRMPPPPGMGAGKSDLATEIAELKAQMAELKGSPPASAECRAWVAARYFGRPARRGRRGAARQGREREEGRQGGDAPKTVYVRPIPTL